MIISFFFHIFFCFFFFVYVIEGILINSNSFAAPFGAVSENGEREVDGFMVAGDALVKQNFIRLTSDRQSKRGSLWCKNPIDAQQLSLMMKFRISGQGKRLFGDGIALWITHHSSVEPGHFHGFTDAFTGIGIIFDTFKNTEMGDKHKDIRLVINDGKLNHEAMMQQAMVGCDSPLRYHETRADFSVFNSSRVRLVIRVDEISLSVDAKSTNNWVDCFTTKLAYGQLPHDWLSKSRIGLTASTGALADNHDVLSLKVWDNADETDSTTTEINSHTDSLDNLIQHLEHQLTAVEEGLTFNIGKLKKQEEKALDRISNLESVLSNKMSDTLEERIKLLEGLNIESLRLQEDEAEKRIGTLEETLNSQVTQTMNQRIAKLEGQLNEKLNQALEDRIAALENTIERRIEQRLSRLEAIMSEKITSSVASVESFSRAWLWPFVVLVLVVVLGLLLLWRKLRALGKQHHF